jgi:hypothetical protein
MLHCGPSKKSRRKGKKKGEKNKFPKKTKFLLLIF